MKKTKYDVAIVGVGVGANYGSVLTYYGLYKTLEEFGKKPILISKIGASKKDPEIGDTHSMKFAKEHYNLSKVYSQKDVGELNDLVDTFILGSDQVFNYGVSRNFGKAFYFDFVNDDKQKISYASSFGHVIDFAPPEEVEKIKPLFRRFNAISVREDSGVDLARDVYGVPATQVSEPVFLLPNEDYLKFAERSNRDVSKPYLLAYVLDPTPEKAAAIKHLAKKQNLDIKIMLDGFPHLFEENLKKTEMEEYVEHNVDTYDFLKLYANSSYVFTDSFHGTSFALKFKKPFTTIGNKRRGMARFQSLFRLIQNKTRFTVNPLDVIDDDSRFLAPMDYKKITSIIDKHVEFSKEWLKKSLNIKPVDTVGKNLKVETALNTNGKLVFQSNSKIWEIDNNKKYPKLQVLKSKELLKGKHAWCSLSKTLKKGKAYELEIKWLYNTTSSIINLHTRDSLNGKFTLIGSVNTKNKSGKVNVDKVTFIAKNTSHSQFMLGAVHFRGEIAGCEIHSIKVREVDKKLVKPTTSLAIPSNIPTRKQAILDIIDNKEIKEWETNLQKLLPNASIFMARELKQYMWNKVGGPADILVFPKTPEQVKKIANYASENNIPLTVLGGGSNVLIRDGGVRGIVIITVDLKYFKLEGNKFIVGAGSNLIESTCFLLNKNKSGLEWAAGIPGTVGGAVYMNAGTYTSDIRSNIAEITILDENNDIKTLKKSDIDWGVRYTTFQKEESWIILEAVFNVKEAVDSQLAKKMLNTVQSRENNMPMENPNHGSTFKWYRAPRLIQQAGLVGTQIGGVQISKKQPGFFINVNQGTASDYESLINLTIAKVYEFSGFLLEPEVEIMGDRPYRYKRYSNESDSDKNQKLT